MNIKDKMNQLYNMPLRDFVKQAEGLRKDSGEAISGLLQERVYEKGFARRLFNIKTVSPSELQQSEHDDNPVIYRDKAVEAPAAATVPFGTEKLELFTYTGKRYPIRFYDIMTPTIIKSHIQLMTYPGSVGKFLESNLEWNIENMEDYTIMRTLEACIDKHPENVIELTGKKFDKEAFKILGQRLVADNMPLDGYKFFTHHNLWLEVLDTDAVQVGDGIASQMFTEGVKYRSGEQRNAFGFNVLTHKKNDLKILKSGSDTDFGTYTIKKHEMYLVPPEEFFGEFCVLRDLKIIHKDTEQNHKFYGYETLGFGVGNTKSVYKVIFTEYIDKLEGVVE
ncbi:MAG: hypothetical protein WCY49_07300 [Anaerovoracaceae bacterium]